MKEQLPLPPMRAWPNMPTVWQQWFSILYSKFNADVTYQDAGEIADLLETPSDKPDSVIYDFPTNSFTPSLSTSFETNILVASPVVDLSTNLITNHSNDFHTTFNFVPHTDLSTNLSLTSNTDISINLAPSPSNLDITNVLILNQNDPFLDVTRFKSLDSDRLGGILASSYSTTTATASAIATHAALQTGVHGISISAGKTLSCTQSITISGTDSTTATFPSTSWTAARTDTGQTFTGSHIFSSDLSVHGRYVGTGTGSGASNTLLGDGLQSATTGYGNTAVGISCMSSCQDGYRNAAVGMEALKLNVSGANNVAMGYEALYSCTGSGNTGLGRVAAYDITSGGNNTIIGFSTGRGITTGSGNLVLGANLSGLSSSLANNIILVSNSTAQMTFDGTNWSIVSSTDATTGTAAASFQTAGGLAVTKCIVSDSKIFNQKAMMTDEGGFAVKLKAGEALNRGEVVYIKQASGTDGSVWKTPTDGTMSIGVVYATVTINSDVWVVTSGIAYVLPTSSITAARGYIIYASHTEAGHVDQNSSASGIANQVGHFLDTGSGNGALTRAIIHFD
jgi:hypothetical protein